MVSDMPYIAGAFFIALAIMYLVVGKERTQRGWEMGKGLIAPTIVIGVVLALSMAALPALPKPLAWALSRYLSSALFAVK